MALYQGQKLGQLKNDQQSVNHKVGDGFWNIDSISNIISRIHGEFNQFNNSKIPKVLMQLKFHKWPERTVVIEITEKNKKL